MNIQNEPQASKSFVYTNLSKKTIVILLFIFLSLCTLFAYYFLIYGQKNDVVENTAQQEYIYKFVDNQQYYKINDGNVYYVEKLYNNDDVSYRETVIINADSKSFIELGNKWAKDTNNVYWEGVAQEKLDSETIAVSYPYVLDKNNVWFYATSYTQKLELTTIDPKTFSAINWFYSKDNNNIYFGSTKMVGADLDSFIPLNVTLNNLEEYDYKEPLYAKDKNNAYFRGEKIEAVDVMSFVHLGKYYAKDKNSIYLNGRKMNIDINPEYFEIVGKDVIKDNKSVFFSEFNFDINEFEYIKASGIDAPSFKFLSSCRCVEGSCGYYFTDDNRVFINKEKNETIDRKSFEIVGSQESNSDMFSDDLYSRDSNNVYINCGDVIEGADPQSFKLLEDGYAEDKNNTYYNGKNTKLLPSVYFKDEKSGFSISYPKELSINKYKIPESNDDEYLYLTYESSVPKFNFEDKCGTSKTYVRITTIPDYRDVYVYSKYSSSLDEIVYALRNNFDNGNFVSDYNIYGGRMIGFNRAGAENYYILSDYKMFIFTEVKCSEDDIDVKSITESFEPVY